PVETHSRTYLVSWQHIGKPCRHTHRAAGKAHSVDDPGYHYENRILRHDISDTGHSRQYSSYKSYPVLRKSVRQVSYHRTAHYRTHIHQSADDPGKDRGSAYAL